MAPVGPRGFPKWVPRFNVIAAAATAAVTFTGYADDGGSVINSKLLYDQYASLPPIATPAVAQTFVDIPEAPTRIRRNKQKNQDVVVPLRPDAGITSSIACATDGGSTIWSKLLYDQFAGPVAALVAPAPTLVDISEAPTRIRRRAQALETVYALPPTVAQPWVDVPAAPAKVRRSAQALEAVLPLSPVAAVSAQTWIDAADASAKIRRSAQALEAVIALPPIVAAVAAQTWVDVPEAPAKLRRRGQALELVIPLPPIVAQPYVGTADDLVRIKRRAQTQEAITPFPPIAAAATAQTLASTHSGLIIRQQLVFQDEIVGPIVLPQAVGVATPATLATTHSGLIIKTQLVFQDEIVGPLPPLAAPAAGTPTPNTYGLWQSEILKTKLWSRKVQPSAFVLAIPDDIWLPADTNQPVKFKRKRLPEEIAAPPQNVGGTVFVGIASTIAAAFESPTVIHSRGLYDQYAGPVGPPAPAAAGTPTTSAFFFDADKPAARRRSKPLQEIAAVFPPKVDIHLATDTSQPQVRRIRRKDSEAFAAPIFQLFGTTTPSEYGWQTPYQLPPTKRAFKPVDALAAKPDQEPPPFVGVPVPSFLFDWTSNGRGYRINGIATAVNDGFTWDPQDPSTLTGTTEPGPVVTPPSTGGLPVTRKSGPRRGVWIEYSKGKKKWREKVAILPPVEAPQEIKDATNVPAPESLKEATRTLSDLKAYTPPVAQPVEPQGKTQAEIDEEDMMIIAIIESLD